MTTNLIGRCPECEEEMELHDSPVEHGFTLFGCEFIMRRWVKQPFCMLCEEERHQRQYERVAESAYDCGFEKGLQHREFL